MIRIKTKEQIDGIRLSCKALARLFKELTPRVQPGVSAKELDDFCVSYIKDIGGVPAWYAEHFPGAACISINEEVIHGIPDKKKIVREGDLVSLDIGIDLNGYISDSCVTVAVGNVSPERAQLLKVTTDCLYAGIAACQAGKRVNAISRAVYDLARQYNYGVVYEYCGHGVGLKVHEEYSECAGTGRTESTASTRHGHCNRTDDQPRHGGCQNPCRRLDGGKRR